MVFQKSSWYTASIKWQVFGQPHKSHGAGKQQLQTMKSFCGWQWYGAANVTAAFQFQLRAEKFCERAHLRRLYAVFRYYLLRMPNHFFFKFTLTFVTVVAMIGELAKNMRTSGVSHGSRFVPFLNTSLAAVVCWAERGNSQNRILIKSVFCRSR